MNDQKSELITHHKDKAVLTLLNLQDLINKDYSIVPPTMKLGELVKVISAQTHNHYPVCDEDGTFVGVVTLNEIRNIMFQPRLYERMTVADIMIGPKGKVQPEMNMAEVMNLFDSTDAWTLPVIDQQGKYLGMLSRQNIYATYRRLLLEFSED